jgi:hypothetical protein
MNNIELRDNLLSQAESAFFEMIKLGDNLLDAAQVYFAQHATITKSDKIKEKNLEIAARDIGSLLKQLASEIERWKRKDRLLSKNGVEHEIINELRVTMEATFMFLTNNNINLSRFTLVALNKAHADLIRSNRLL